MQLTRLAAEVWRLYVTAGNPLSGRHEPDVTEVELLGTELEARIALALGFGILDRDLNSPPGSPSTGDKYIVGATPAGGWTTFDPNDVVEYDGAAWQTETPEIGWKCYVVDEAITAVFNGTAWVNESSLVAMTAKQANFATYMRNGTIVHSRAAGAETIAIKTQAGADPSAGDPVYFFFRDVAAATGGYVMRIVTAALSVTIPSTALMGFTSGVAGRLWLIAIDNAGTVELAVGNCLSGTNIYPLGQFPIISTTIINTSSDSAHVFYSTTARSSLAYSVLGYASWEGANVLATAGTWNTAPLRIELFGPNTPLPGAVIQTQGNTTGAVATGTTVLPNDDTIPQSGEGVQFLTQAITPTSACNVLRVMTAGILAHSANGALGWALFQDSTASAIAAARFTADAVNAARPTPTIDHWMQAGALSATTFKARGGSAGAGTATFNGASAARLLGGVMNSYMRCTELMA